MKFSELSIGDMFNTKPARYVKVSDTEAMVVMSGIFEVGSKHNFENYKSDVIVLYSTQRVTR